VLDELVFGVREAAWPLIRRDLGLDYVAIGLLITIPNLVGALVQPVLGLLGDTGRRRAVVLGGGVAFAGSLLLVASADGFGPLLVAFCILGPASGAFVSLAMATMLDARAGDRDRAMAMWVAAGSVGVVLGPLALAAAVRAGFGWRAAMVVAAALTVPVWLAATRIRFPRDGQDRQLRHVVRDGLAALRRGAVWRWLVLLQLTDLLGDVFLGFVALYFVDVAGTSPVTAAVGVTVFAVAGLVGDAVLVPLLRRLDGLSVLRITATAMLVVYPMFLLAPHPGVKLVLLAAMGLLHAGWYAIPQARLFDEFPGSSGTAVAISDIGSLAGHLLPLFVGVFAQRAGLGPAMWLLLAAPIALLGGLPRKQAGA
jgi:FSR family fosmidomycin resistance protein-like MFS transporter